MATRAIVSGRVQGVGFRWATMHEARRLGLSGTVVNLADGRVEVVVDGSGPAVDELLAWLRHGPDLAQVTGVETAEAADTGQEGFRVL
jgi:acylphosphatase